MEAVNDVLDKEVVFRSHFSDLQLPLPPTRKEVVIGGRTVVLHETNEFFVFRRGEYRTKSRWAVDYLRSMRLYGVDFHEVAEEAAAPAGQPASTGQSAPTGQPGEQTPGGDGDGGGQGNGGESTGDKSLDSVVTKNDAVMFLVTKHSANPEEFKSKNKVEVAAIAKEKYGVVFPNFQ